MQKIYLIYDEYNPPVECDYGFIKEMIYLGFLYHAINRSSSIIINNGFYTIQSGNHNMYTNATFN